MATADLEQGCCETMNRMSTSEALPDVALGGISPVQATTLVSSVFDQLRSAILKGQLPMGSAMKDSVIAAQMNISRGPVREALRLLEISGLADKTTNKPYFVKTFSAVDLRDLALFRIALETTAARVIVRQSLDVTRIAEALDSLVAAIRRGVVVDIADQDRRFHSELVACAESPRLASAYGRLRDQTTLALLKLEETSVPRFEGSAERHTDLLGTLERCIASGDSTDIEDALIVHIRNGMGCPDLVY